MTSQLFRHLIGSFTTFQLNIGAILDIFYSVTHSPVKTKHRQVLKMFIKVGGAYKH